MFSYFTFFMHTSGLVLFFIILLILFPIHSAAKKFIVFGNCIMYCILHTLMEHLKLYSRESQ